MVIGWSSRTLSGFVFSSTVGLSTNETSIQVGLKKRLENQKSIQSFESSIRFGPHAQLPQCSTPTICILSGKLNIMRMHLLLSLNSYNCSFSKLLRDQLQSFHDKIKAYWEWSCQKASKRWNTEQNWSSSWTPICWSFIRILKTVSGIPWIRRREWHHRVR